MECHPGGILRAAGGIHPAKGGKSMTGLRNGRRRLGALSLVLVGALLVAAGCGKPAYTYIANKDAKTYFKVPAGWERVDPQPIDFVFAEGVFGAQTEDSELVQEFKRASWSVLYTAPEDP